MKINIKFFLLLFSLIFLQLLWYNHLKLYGRFVPVIYIYPLLLLPFSQNNIQLFLAFLTGLILDLFLHTGGVFTAVTLFIVYIKRIFILPFIHNRRADEEINPLNFSFNHKIVYFGTAVFFSLFFINLLESFSLSYVIYKIPLFIINTLLSLIILIFIDYLFINRSQG